MAERKPIRKLSSTSALDAALERFQNVHSDIDKRFIAREAVIEVILFAVALREHVLLEGPPGTAKSAIANAVFQSFAYRDPKKEVSRFSKMLMIGTTLEELFGPMDIKLFREQSTVRINTKGMLPSAQFVFLDEVYRGSDALLSSTLNVLNERVFTNGSEVQRCPLLTAIGTTNFQSDSPIIEAFKDRWLLNVAIQPLVSSAQRLKMLEGDTNPVSTESKAKIWMEDLDLIWDAVQRETFPSDIAEVYDNISEQLAKKLVKARVSDRRFVKGARLLRTAKVLSGLDDFSADCFDMLRYVLVDSSKEEQGAFDEVFENVIGSLERSSREAPFVKAFRDEVNALSNRYVSNMPKAKLRTLYEDVTNALLRINRTSNEDNEDETPAVDVTIPELREEFANSLSKLQEIKFSMETDLAITSADLAKLTMNDGKQNQ